ncbi:HNH endonuclease [Candidatus Poriferisocius sp.]|uniref:HNH endonuclease n=1 Tax=Candidatus Poriferisocius sp. TaxID=3101276 RepID=UPI003B5A4DB4
MTSIDSRDRPDRFDALVRSLTEIYPDISYYAATLFKTGTGEMLGFFSRWAGLSEEYSLDKGIELRRAVPVEPEKYSRLWQEQGWIAVNDDLGVLVFFGVGGNAFIAEDIARKYFAVDLEPHPVASNGGVGFRHYDPKSREVTKRRLRPRQKRRILDSDGYQCKICHKRQSAWPEIELQAHHIRPFSQGGLTIDENLITLCSECHQSLDPHFQWDLFLLPDGPYEKSYEQETAATHPGGAEGHRRRVASLLDDLAGRG